MDHRPHHDPILSEFAHDPEMKELLEMFVSELPQRLSAIQAAWDVADGEAVRRIAHQLKGASGGYGFAPIGAAAARLESVLRAEASDLQTAQTELEALIELCHRAQA